MAGCGRGDDCGEDHGSSSSGCAVCVCSGIGRGIS